MSAAVWMLVWMVGAIFSWTTPYAWYLDVLWIFLVWLASIACEDA